METHIRCRLCGLEFKHVGWSHLLKKHGIRKPATYKARFGLSRLTAPATLLLMSENNTSITGPQLATIKKSWATVDIKNVLAPRLGYTRDTVRKHARRLGLGAKREKWSRKRVIKELRDRVARGLPVRIKYLKRRKRKLYTACRVHFGNPRKACRAAGIDYGLMAFKGSNRRWTKERVLSEIKRLTIRSDKLKYDRVPRALISAATRECGSWKKARLMAGCG